MCARVSSVVVSFFSRQRLKAPLLNTFPCRGACAHVRTSTLHQGSLSAPAGLAAHVLL